MSHANFLYFRLAELCTIHAGLSVRGKLETGADGDAPVILLRDTGEGHVVPEKLQRAHLGEVDSRYCAARGDILFRTRFEPNIAIHLSEFPGQAVVIAPLVTVRVAAPELDPAYLAWYINQPPAQAEIARGARGTNLRMVPRQVLDQLPIALPDIETQRRIVEVDRLSEREGVLLNALALKRRELARVALLARAHGAARSDSMDQADRSEIGG